jgi:hypothetical protein
MGGKIVEELAVKLADWTYENYGRAGCIAGIVIFIAVSVLIVIIIKRLTDSGIL